MFTSLSAARQLVERRQLRPMLLLQQDALQDFEGIQQDNPNCVVIGLAPDCFNYEQMNKAFRYAAQQHLTTMTAKASATTKHNND